MSTYLVITLVYLVHLAIGAPACFLAIAGGRRIERWIGRGWLGTVVGLAAAAVVIAMAMSASLALSDPLVDWARDLRAAR